MVVDCVRASAGKDIPRADDFIGRAVGDHNELVGLERGLILENAVLRNTKAGQAGAKRTHSADHDCAFERPNDPGNERSGHEERPQAWNHEEGGPK